MSARKTGFTAAALLAAGCERDPAPGPPPAEHSPPIAKIRLVAPVAPVAADRTANPAPLVGPSLTDAAAPLRTAFGEPASLATAKPPASYPPRDECAVLPGFVAFRDKLAAAVRKRDAAAVAALADPAVRLDFGGGAGADELRTRLTSTRPELWRALDDLLLLGCAADGGLATLPWVFARMPEAVDPYRAMLVLGGKVLLRERPTASAPAAAELAWALVTPLAGESDAKARFVEVATADSALRGFVESASLRSLLDYRLVAEPQDGHWAITAFLAGD